MEEFIKRRLLARGVLATDDWFNTLANNFRFCDEYAPGPEILEKYIFQQWLQVNLWELQVSSFPPDLENQLKVTLNGRYTCQIVSVIDSGVSAYSQYQKVRKVDTANLAVDNEKETFQKKWEPKSSRTLLLSITDGTQELVVLEAKRIPALSINLKPGCKAIIKGPVICRQGFIILKKEEQISILGGEVESFLIPNAYENILALSLGLPMNENPRIATGAADELISEDEGNQQVQRNTNTRVEVNRPAVPVRTPAQRPVVRAPVHSNRPEARPQEVRQPGTNSSLNFQLQEDDFPDDDVLMSIDLDQVVATQEQNKQNTDNTSKRVALPSDLNPQFPKRPPSGFTVDIDDEIAKEFSYNLDEADFNEQVPPRRSSANSNKTSSSAQLKRAFESQDSAFPVVDDDDDIVWPNEENFAPQNGQTVPAQNSRTENEWSPEHCTLKLAEVVRNISERKFKQPTKVKVKVKIHRVVESLNVKNEEWKMAVNISDESDVLEVSMSSETINKLFGITPAEGAKRRKEAVTNPAIKEDLKKAFHRLEITLKELHCIFEVLINPGERPRVVNIEI